MLLVFTAINIKPDHTINLFKMTVKNNKTDYCINLANLQTQQGIWVRLVMLSTESRNHEYNCSKKNCRHKNKCQCLTWSKLHARLLKYLCTRALKGEIDQYLVPSQDVTAAAEINLTLHAAAASVEDWRRVRRRTKQQYHWLLLPMSCH